MTKKKNCTDCGACGHIDEKQVPTVEAKEKLDLKMKLKQFYLLQH